MSFPETMPYPDWDGWWRASPYIVSLAAGAFAGMSAETVLFPLDCLKTRVQCRQGFWASGGFRGIHRGLGIAIAGSAPASAIFFSTYELTMHTLAGNELAASNLPFWVRVTIASVFGELAASSLRVPVDVVKQRLQAGYRSSFLLPMHSSIFLASFKATAMRDVTHSSLQFPLYEGLKHAAAAQWASSYGDSLPTWVAASCGSVAGVVSATLTTPFDLVKTRVNLRAPPETDAGGHAHVPSSKTLVAEEVRQIYSSKGAAGFFAGASYRAAWMGLGGFVFLGSFEFAKERLSRRADAEAPTPRVAQRQAEDAAEAPKPEPPAATVGSGQALAQPPQPRLEPSPSTSFAAGLVAGVAVDVPLHPVDTLKTRLQAREGFGAAGGWRGVWSGLSAVLIMSVPGSAVFFVVYDQMQHLLERHAPVALGGGGGRESLPGAVWRDAVSASLADISACSVRVPCEVVKQRMQTRSVSSTPASVLGTVRKVNAEGLKGFYAGFGATVSREVPFALIQMPLFEELKERHPWTASARREGDTSRQGLIGMMSGGLAGAIAGFLTTPFDTAKTRIMLTAKRVERRGLLETLMSIRTESGLRGLFFGVAPRTLQCGAGGALWLGAFEWSKLLLSGRAAASGTR